MTQSKRAADYIYRLQIDGRVIQRQFDGLTHEDTLLQPDMRGNCANWTLGHIVYTRNSIMKTLGLEPIWNDEEVALYRPESEPITDADCEHLPLEKLLADFETAGEKIVACLETITDEELDAAYNENSPLAQSLNFNIWHEGYHVGQFEYLRQLTGVNDKVI